MAYLVRENVQRNEKKSYWLNKKKFFDVILGKISFFCILKTNQYAKNES